MERFALLRAKVQERLEARGVAQRIEQTAVHRVCHGVSREEQTKHVFQTLRKSPLAPALPLKPTWPLQLDGPFLF